MLRRVNGTFTIDTDEYYPVLRQFRILAQGHCWRELCQLTKTANFKATPMKKHLAVYYLLIGDTSQVSVFFSWQIKISNLLHVGLILIISKVFTILVYFACVGIREYHGNFQNEKVTSKFFFKGSAQVKWEGKPFWSGQEA